MARGHGSPNEFGIRAWGDGLVVGNTCQGNDVGIEARSTGNRIDGNSVTGGQTGIKATLTRNIIVRNSVSAGGTHYDIVAGNQVGTISSDPTTAGPWDNFEPIPPE